MDKNEYLRVGKIVGTHGIQGEVRVLPTTDFPEERFRSDNKLLCTHPLLEGPLVLTVMKSRPHKGVYLIRFTEWDSINTAEKYRNGTLMIPREELPPLEHEEEYYCHEIVGCEVITTSGEPKGCVVEVLKYPANDVWVCRDGNKEFLLPFIADVVKEVDVKNRQVNIEWLEGMD